MSNRGMGGPAFPIPLNPGERYDEHGPHDGMTLWDYYAAAALQGLCASGPHDCDEKGIAHDARLFAEAMLAERKRRMGDE